MHGETAAWHIDCMHADVLAMQETCRSCAWVGQEDPNMGNGTQTGSLGSDAW